STAPSVRLAMNASCSRPTIRSSRPTRLVSSSTTCHWPRTCAPTFASITRPDYWGLNRRNEGRNSEGELRRGWRITLPLVRPRFLLQLPARGERLRRREIRLFGPTAPCLHTFFTLPGPLWCPSLRFGVCGR